MILPDNTTEAYKLGMQHYQDKEFIKSWKLRLAYQKQRMKEILAREDKLMMSWSWFRVQMLNEALSVATGMQTLRNLREVLGTNQ